ncbi:excalibur calcium-binding domain-containing protein [Sphingomonas daechungensis]|uniref:excalibur calcium-binding domain-containing protein n=1 Tax=Sphingomonas daechungensis TaxID=1176646 RepID=UPI003782F1AE
MNKWFEGPVERTPWTYDPAFFESAARRRRGLGQTIAVGLLATNLVFLLGMAFTNRNNLPLYYPTCDWARFVGAAPIAKGQKGYRQALDSDGDGIACEPYQDP